MLMAEQPLHKLQNIFGRLPRDMTESNQRVILSTPRLLLRPAYSQDAESLFNAFSDPEVMRFWDSTPHKTIAETRTWVDKMMASPANGVTDFIVCFTSNALPTSPTTSAGGSSGSTTSCNTPRSQSIENTGLGAQPEQFPFEDFGSPVIGKIGIWNTQRSEIGFLLARNYWRQGLISEAMGILLPYFFEKRGIEKITADIDPANVASQGVLEKFGFRVVGRRENTFCIAGVWVDSLDLELTREEYRKQMGAFARTA